MRNYRIPLHILAVVLVLASTASAQLTISEYERLKSTERIADYIAGIGNGFVWSNSELVRRGKQPLYCQPQAEILSVSKYIQIIDQTLSKKEPDANTAVESVLLAALTKRYPCAGEPTPNSASSSTLGRPHNEPLVLTLQREMSDAMFPGKCEGVLTVTPSSITWSPAKEDCANDWSAAWSDVEELSFNCSSQSTGGCMVYLKAPNTPLRLYSPGAADSAVKLRSYIGAANIIVRQTCVGAAFGPCRE